MSVLLGGGALLEFCASASQHFFMLGPAGRAPVGVAEVDADGVGSGSIVGMGAGAGATAAVGGAGNGGGGSSLGQAVSAKADRSIKQRVTAALVMVAIIGSQAEGQPHPSRRARRP
jgi:hypothetical protein